MRRKPYKILQLTGTSAIGGAEVMALTLAKHLNRGWFEPAIASLGRPGPLMQMSGEAKIPVHSCSSFSVLGLVSRFDLVHTYGFKADMLVRLLGNSKQKPKVVCGIRSIDLGRIAGKVWLDRWTQSLVDLFVANCEAGRQSRIQREKISADRIITILSGTELNVEMEDPGPLREALNISPEAFPVVAHVANLRPMKGHSVALQAIRELKNEFPWIVFLFAGRDDSDGRYQREARKLGVMGHCRFLGFCAEPRRVLRASDIAILPSQYEGFPVALLEAMAERKPVVASRVGGIPEAISDGREGILIQPDDPEALAAAVRRLAMDQGLRRAMGAAGRNRVENEFSITRMVGKYEEAYLSLLGD